MMKIITVFGTRPEVIKLAPVIRALEARKRCWRTVSIATGQHTDLLYPVAQRFGLRIDHNLGVMTRNQNLNSLFAKIVERIEPVLAEEDPGLVLVQGDTTTAIATALAAFNRGIPVGHVEAGLRSGDLCNPFPEEANRRLISQVASLHFAPTSGNRDQLIAEGVLRRQIFVTGNPVVDALRTLVETAPGERVKSILASTEGTRRLVLTAHRRENFGRRLDAYFQILRDFVARSPDVSLVFPVHPNPAVRAAASRVFRSHPNVHLLEPLEYPDFIALLNAAWLIVSDSGGIQEEAVTLRKPLIVLRSSTERPEAVETGLCRLVGSDPSRLAELLDMGPGWSVPSRAGNHIGNPFGQGDSAERIADALEKTLLE